MYSKSTPCGFPQELKKEVLGVYTLSRKRIQHNDLYEIHKDTLSFLKNYIVEFSSKKL